MKKALVIRLSSAGDILITGRVIAALKKSGYGVHLACKAKFAEAGAAVLPDKLLKYAPGKSFTDLLNAEKYDAVIDLQDNLRSFFLRLAVKSPVKKVYRKNTLRRRLMVLFKWFLKDNKSVAEKYMEAAAGLLKPVKPAAQRRDKALIRKKSIRIHIHDGAQWGNKRWPYFGELVRELLKIKNVRITVTGVKDEVDNSDGLLYYKDRRVVNLIGRTAFSGLMKEIKKADLFIGNDTAAAHAARLFGKPALVFMGPTSGAFGFITENDFMVIENKELMCRPCHLHGGNKCPIGSFDCMKSVTAADVMDRIKKIIPRGN